jgi:hypothetical protein
MDKWYILLPELVVAALLIVIGCAIKYRKAYWLISGYNTLPEEKKKNVDAEGLGRFIGNCLFTYAALIAAAFAFFALGWTAAGLAALGLMLAGIVLAVVRAQKYDGNARKPGGGFNARTAVLIAATVVLLGGAAALVAAIISSSSKPIVYTVSGGSLTIECPFGQTVTLKDIEGLETTRAKPDISMRTWGSAVGEKLRGSFSLANGASARIFAESATPPFIHFKVGGTEYYLNCATPEKTDKLYTDLQILNSN